MGKMTSEQETKTETETAENIIVNLKLPNKRAYEITWSLCLLKGYQNLDEFVSDIVLDRIEVYADGRASLTDSIDWDLKQGMRWKKKRRKSL